mgnify:CR=1 FL=1
MNTKDLYTMGSRLYDIMEILEEAGVVNYQTLVEWYDTFPLGPIGAACLTHPLP